jgi:hypothetical protein
MDTKKSNKPNSKPSHPVRAAKRPAVSLKSDVAIAFILIRTRLDVARSLAYVCAATLRGQRTDHDLDVATCLQRLIGDALADQVNAIDRLLGRDGTQP